MVDLYYIEDDQNIALAVKEYLESKNFHVTICATLAAAKQKIRDKVPTCILLDWNMPDGRGDSLCQWIRGNWKELPVIFLTVRSDSSDIVSGFKNGADDYVVKPFEFEVLYSRILDELYLKRRKKSRLLSLLFGVEGELAGNALKAQKKALRTSSLSFIFSFLAFAVM